MKVLTFISLLFIIACGDNDSSCDIEFDTPFAVEEGMIYCHPEGGQISITAIDNSYCPCNVECIWAGEAYVEGMFTDESGNTSEFRIHEERTEESTDGFSISSVETDNACEATIQTIRITYTALE